MLQTNEVSELLDREAIRELSYRFAESLDNRDWTLLESLCDEELEADFTAWGIPAQRMKAANFVALFQQSFWRPDLVTQHLYTNFRIRLEGAKAYIVFNFLGQHYVPGFADGEEFFLRGEYTDTLVRQETGWKLSAVKLRVFYTSGAASMLYPQA